jgi:WD40 repeat protein
VLASVAASPDGELLAVAGVPDSGNAAQLWTADGSKLKTLADGDVAITCLAWSPDGTQLAGGSRAGDVALWDRQGNLTRTIHGTDPVFSLAWSRDGSILAVGAIHFPPPTATGNIALPGVVRLWNRDIHLTQTLETELTGGKFLNLAWSPDGSMLAAGAMDYKVWRADGTQVGVPRANGTPAWAMTWSPDGRELAIGDENGGLRIVGPDGSAPSLSSFVGGIDFLAYSPDGASLAVGSRSTVRVVKAADGQTVLWSVTGDAAYTIWSADGRALISASHGLALMSPSGELLHGLAACPGNIGAFSWDGALVAAVTDSGWLCSWRSQA